MNRVNSHPFKPTPRPVCFWSLVLVGLAGSAWPLAAQSQEMEEIAHPFFTHEGLPDAVGRYSLRTSALATRIDGATKGDVAFHLETGLTPTIGLHLRSDQFLQSRRSEVMFQFVAWKSQDGESGFAPIIEFEVPTRSGGGKPATLVGFTSKVGGPQFAFNQALHYNPAEKAVEISGAVVLRATERVYPVVEVFGMAGADKATIVNLLAGVKYRLPGGGLIGLAYQRPVTNARELSSQWVAQLEFMLGSSSR